MDSNENFEINYWGEDFKSIYLNPQTPKRTVKQKFLIVFLFVSVLAILPAAIFGISNLNANSSKISSAIKVQTEPTQAPTPTPKPAIEVVESNIVEVINNDSYWKISKRVCGTGKYYLSISSQNNGKALYQGERVKVYCNI